MFEINSSELVSRSYSWIGRINNGRYAVGSDYLNIMSCEKVVLPSGMFTLGSKFGYVVTGKCSAGDHSISGSISSHTLFLSAVNQSFPEL